MVIRIDKNIIQNKHLMYLNSITLNLINFKPLGQTNKR